MLGIRLLVLLPALCAIPAFILSMLCLYAGSSQGFMEDYSLMVLNTSMLGETLVNSNGTNASTTTTSMTSTATATATSSAATSTTTGHHFRGGNRRDVEPEDRFGHSDHGILKNISSSLENELQNIEGDLANQLAASLGIDQWYSMHLMNMCYGNYNPNATDSSASMNISKCTNPTSMYHFDPASTIATQLSIGPFKLNLTDVGWNTSMTNNISELYPYTDAMYGLYCLAATFCAIAMLTGIAGFVKQDVKLLININWIVCLIATIALFIASIFATAVVKKTVDQINDESDQVGVVAAKGKKYFALTWAASGLMIAATLCWFMDCYLFTNRRHIAYAEKKLRDESHSLSDMSTSAQQTTESPESQPLSHPNRASDYA